MYDCAPPKFYHQHGLVFSKNMVVQINKENFTKSLKFMLDKPPDSTMDPYPVNFDIESL